MKKKILAVIAIVAITLPSVYSHFMLPQTDVVLSGNLEALTSGDEFQCIYNRDDNDLCKIYIGVGAKVKLGGISIKADANGYIYFSGKVVCGDNGNWSCRPIECLDIYNELLS